MTWHLISILSPILLAVYLIITDFVDLFPFNDVSKHKSKTRTSEILINYPVPIIAGILNMLNTREHITSSIIIGLIFLAGNLWSWWIPYFFWRL